MNNLERPRFFDNTIECTTMVANLGFFALFINLLADVHPTQIIYARRAQPLQEGPRLIIIEQNPRTLFAYILKNSYRRLEVSNMKSRQSQLDMPKMAIAIRKPFAASLANSRLRGRPLSCDI